MNTLPKVVVSTTLTSADWSNSTVVGGNLAEEVTKLKQQPGKGIAVFGSPSLTSAGKAGTIVRRQRSADFSGGPGWPNRHRSRQSWA